MCTNTACTSEVVPSLGERSITTDTPSVFATTSPTSTPEPIVFTPTPIMIFTLTAIPELPNTPTPIPTTALTPLPVLAEVTLPTPKPHNHPIASSEIKQVHFVDVNTLAYLQWGTIYTHNLLTRQTKAIIGSGDIDSFDWSDSQQQFVVVKNGHLLLFDVTGTLVKNLSDILPPIYPNPEFVKACSWNKMTEGDNLLEYVKWVLWNPVDANIILGAANINDYITHHCGPKIWFVNIEKNQIVEVGDFKSYDPKPQWLNRNSILLDYYEGGGSHKYDVVDVSRGETILEFDTYAGFTESSASGTHLVNVSELQVSLRAWNTITGNELWDESFPYDTVVYRNAWSFDERYIAVSQGQGLFSYSPDNLVSLLVLDVNSRRKQKLEHKFSDYIFPVWFPDKNNILVFEQRLNDEGSNIFLADPESQTVEFLSGYPNYQFMPIEWSTNNQYLPLIEQQENRSIWLMDRQSIETPFLVYELDTPDYVAWFDNFNWNLDNTWLIFTEQSGEKSIPLGADISLQAIHIPTGESHSITIWEIDRE